MADESKPKPVSLEELMVSTLAKLVIAKGIITEEFKCRASELSTRAEANALSPCWLDQLFLLENSQTSTAMTPITSNPPTQTPAWKISPASSQPLNRNIKAGAERPTSDRIFCCRRIISRSCSDVSHPARAPACTIGCR